MKEPTEEELAEFGEMYPDLDKDQVKEAHGRFMTYIDQTIVQYERIIRDPEEHARLRRLLKEARREQLDEMIDSLPNRDEEVQEN